jgi:hypothetical protein
VLLAACTISGAKPAPVTARPPADPDRMPSAVLDKQDPGADTSKNPVLSRTSAHYVDNDSQWAGCLRLLACDSGGGHGDASGVLIVLAALAATRKRNRS